MAGYTILFNRFPRMSARQYLELHHGQWRVSVPVPKGLQGQLGKTRLKRALGTDSLKEANVLKWSVIAEFKAEMYGTPKPLPAGPRKEAMEIRQALARALPEEREALLDYAGDRAEDLSGPPIGEDPLTGETLQEPKREREALAFLRIARGEITPWDDLVVTYHKERPTKEGTKEDDRLALRRLKAWCEAQNLEAAVETITRRVAGRYVSELVGDGGHPASINKTVSRLSSFWRWLVIRGYVDDGNPWQGQRLAEPKPTERPFTDKEMKRLLEGVPDKASPSPDLLLLMKIGALTGARIDAIISLRARDRRDDAFTFKAMKKEPKARQVPIHSAIKKDIKARLATLRDDDHLFAREWPSVATGHSEASHAAVKAFGRYRQACGVHERAEKQRRSNVNFHSFRRWFATKAEHAGIPPHTIESVTGHRRGGEALGTYSSGASWEQKEACVEAVKLP